ncbi:hypothetical protein ACTNDY_06550 [Tissierellaceae bacterium HCP3S3_D8]
MAKKREPIKVIIVNPEAIPIARDRLTLGLIKIQEKRLKEKELAKV